MSSKSGIRCHEEAVEHWIPIMEEYGNAYRTTKISAMEWCKQRQISVVSFYRWRRKLLKEPQNPVDVSSSEYAKSSGEQAASLTFIDVTALAAASDPARSETSSSTTRHTSSGIPSIMIQVNGVQIYVNDGVDEATLNTVLKAVRNA